MEKNNVKEPKGAGGSFMLWSMNWGHSILAKWGLEYLSIKANDHILDIGCGGGANIARMLQKAANGKVYGIDHALLSVDKSTKLNKKAICENRCEIKQSGVSHIAYSDETFDIVTAFETIYFWPDIANDAKEIARILKSGGVFFICNEAVNLGKRKPANEYFEKLLDFKIYSPNDFRNILTMAGFVDIQINISKNNEFVCVIARKP